MNKRILPDDRETALLLCVVVFNSLIYNEGRFLARGSLHLRFGTLVDDAIPFLPWTVLIYWGCYLFWTINYVLGVKGGGSGRNRFIAAHFIGESICFLAFVFLPTTMRRPEITGNTFCESIVRITCQNDSADNLLPSIHCFVSWLCWIGVRDNPSVPRWYRTVSLLLAAAVCISTLTVKQHVIADVFTGVLLAEFSYFLAGVLYKDKRAAAIIR